MLNYLLSILLIFSSFSSFSQKQKKAKPVVAVYGHDLTAFSAAMQSAQSGAETIWLLDTSAFHEKRLGNDAIPARETGRLDGGTWNFVLEKLIQHSKLKDSTMNLDTQRFDEQVLNNVINHAIDTMKRLQVHQNTEVKRLKRTGKLWELTVNDKQRIKIRSIVDASDNNFLFNMALEASATKKPKESHDRLKYTIAADSLGIRYKNNLYRTAGVAGNLNGKVFSLPLATLFPDSAENFFRADHSIVDFEKNSTSFSQLIAFNMALGQALGASAAYCSIFQTTADRINIRTLQGELLAFGTYLMPFQDIPRSDRHFDAIQRIGASGVLKGNTLEKNGKLCFFPEQTASILELEPILKQLYTRSQLWFLQTTTPKEDPIKLNDLISLIQFTGNRGDELPKDIEAGWTKRFEFPETFSLERTLTRREIAVLLDAYLAPFNRRIKFNGAFQY